MHHVAIMRKSLGFTPKVSKGQKSIESRWYVNKSRPWDAIQQGDVVFFKDTGQPVTVSARVSYVLQFADLTPEKVVRLLDMYGDDIGLNDNELPAFAQRHQNKRYCILIFLEDPVAVEPFHVNKAGFGAATAWLTVPSVEHIKVKNSNHS